MNSQTDWRDVWNEKSSKPISDFELDRGRSPDQASELLAERELATFVDPQAFDTVLDAGCGTGANLERFDSRVKKMIGIDYSIGSIERCRRKTLSSNTMLYVASVTKVPLPDRSVSKVLCLSVLQYLNDQEVRKALDEFVRVLTPGGTIVLHVKNLSSLYWSTLLLAKRAKRLLGRDTKIEYFRTFGWYVRELAAVNCTLVDYYSSNLLTLDLMPPSLVSRIRRFELRRHHKSWFRNPVVRRHGAELVLKAKLLSS